MRSEICNGFAMKKILFLFVVCLLASMQVGASAAKLTMAVNVFGSVTPEARNLVESAFLQRLSGNKSFVVFERNNAFINRLNREIDFQTSGNVPVSEIRAIGARMGVDYVTLVNIDVVCDEVVMTARIVNLETGQIIKTVTDSRQMEDLGTFKGMASTIAYRLYSNTSK